jgi:hypothetical protein
MRRSKTSKISAGQFQIAIGETAGETRYLPPVTGRLLGEWAVRPAPQLPVNQGGGQPDAGCKG